MNRTEVIQYLITNCDCWKGNGGREVLSGMNDEMLGALKQQAERDQKAIAVANAAVKGIEHGGSAYRINPETGQWETRALAANNPVPPQFKKKKQEGKGKEKEPEEDMEDMMEEEEEDEEEEELETNSSRRRQRQAVTNSNRPQTAEDWFRQAPVEVQNTFNYARQIEQREKDTIIAKLLVNVAESARPAQRERLRTRSLADLQNDLALVPEQQDDFNRISTPIRNSTRAQDEDVLVPPSMSWQAVGKGGDAAQGQQEHVAVVDNSGGADVRDLEGWLQSAPPGIRNAVNNARVIEERERRKLIDELTANLDDEQEKRIRRRLQGKPLEELRDMLALAPKQTKANYFGSQGAPPTGNVRSNDVNEDILPIPKMDWSKAE